MKVAILYICTGKYSIFWKKFYESCEQFFLPEAEKKYFVFSDTLDQGECAGNVEIIYQKKMGWPDDTLMRYHLFASIAGGLKQFDYIFFCNANTVFRQIITFDLLKIENADPDLVVVRHPFFLWVKNPGDFPYERNPHSTACIKNEQGRYYVMGGFNGGKALSFLELIETLKKNIETDRSSGILARWHDESHLNKYICELKSGVKILDHNFGFPEGHDLPLSENVYIEFSDKEKVGGHDFLRDKENSIPAQPQQSTNLLQKIKSRFRRKHAR